MPLNLKHQKLEFLLFSKLKKMHIKGEKILRLLEYLIRNLNVSFTSSKLICLYLGVMLGIGQTSNLDTFPVTGER